VTVRRRKWTDKAGREREAWMVHIKHTHPDGRVQQVRKVSPVNTRRGAEQYERDLRRALVDGTWSAKTSPDLSTPERERPATVAEFVEVFLREHGQVEGLRPSTISTQRAALTLHVVPVVGKVPMSDVGSKHFGQVKLAMWEKNANYSPKTINGALVVFARMVRFWYERDGFDMPHIRVGLLKLAEVEPVVCNPDAFARMASAARGIGPEALAIVLLMGDAGLRQGEVRGLKFGDILFDAEPPSLRIQRALDLHDNEYPPKSNRNRTIPMTPRLTDALREQTTRSRFKLSTVFVREDGSPLTRDCVRARLLAVEKAAGIEGTGRSHHMRHLWATDLSAAGVSARVIKELIGHSSLVTTLRYMHLQEGQSHAAIDDLDGRRAGAHAEHTKVRPLEKARAARSKRASKR
jgi:integrase